MSFKKIAHDAAARSASTGEDSTNLIAVEASRRNGRTSRVPVPVFDRGGDVSTEASQRLQSAGDAAIQGLLNAPDEAPDARSTAAPNKAQPTLTDTLIPLAKEKYAESKVTAKANGPIEQPSYMPGNEPVEKAPAMPRIDMDMSKAPVFDRGGSVNVRDGKHQIAVLEDGERVLTPEETKQYERRHSPRRPSMTTKMPRINLFDDGGDVASDDQNKLKPIVIPAPTEQSRGVLRSDANAEPSQVLIPEQSPEEKAVETDKKAGMGAGPNGFVKLGTALIHENVIKNKPEPTTSDVAGPIAERPTSGIPKIAAPQEFHQDAAGGALISGAPTSETPAEQRDLRNMDRKAQADRLEQQRQEALKAGDLETADKLAVAKSELQKTPWGDRSLLGKIGKVASTAVNIGGDIVAPNIMAQIPGTALNRAIKEKAAFNRIPIESEADQREASVSAKESPRPKVLPGESNTAVTPDGTRYQRYEMPDGSTAWAKEGEVPRAAAPQTTTGGLPRINIPTTGGLPAGAVVGKAAGEPKAETREQHLNRYAELKNLQESGATLGDQDQKELNTLKTELTVPKATLDSYNRQIDSALHAAGVDQTLWSNYHAQPGATAEEVKQAIADAKAFSGETYQQGAEGRTMDKEERAQERKDKSTSVYAEDENGQIIKTSKFDADKRGLVSEEMKAGDINKDRQALRMLNDVQINTSRYTKAASVYSSAGLTDEQKKSDRDNISKMLNKSGMYDMEASISQGGHITVPVLTATTEAASRLARSDEYKALSREGKELYDGYIRTMAAVPAYQKALTGIGRSNKEMLDLELANIANPTMDPEDIMRKQTQFQENIKQATAGFPNNLPGIKHPSETQRETEKTSGSAQSLSVEAPNGTVYNFKTKAEADAFRKKAGL